MNDVFFTSSISTVKGLNQLEQIKFILILHTSGFLAQMFEDKNVW